MMLKMYSLVLAYRDATCWESYSGAGDAQCAARGLSVLAKNGSTFYPYVGDLETL